MEIEHVTRIRFTPRRTTQHQRQLTIGRRLLGQVVVHAQRGLAFVVHEVLGHRATRVGRDVQHGRRIGRRRRHDDRVLQRAGLAQSFHHRRDSGRLLTNGDVHANDAGPFLIDDRVHGDRGLARTTVADDQLTLAPTDRNHRVDGLDTRLQRLFHRLAHNDTGCRRFDFARVRGVDVTQTINGTPKGIDHSTDHFGTNRHFQYAAGAPHLIAFLELQIVAEYHRADVVFFEIECEASDHGLRFRGRELEHLAGHGLAESVNAGNAVLHFQHRSDFFDVQVGEVGSGNLTEEDVLDFAGAKGGLSSHDASARKAEDNESETGVGSVSATACER